MSLSLSKSRIMLEKYQVMQVTCMLLNQKIYMVIPSVKLLSMSLIAISSKDKILKQKTNIRVLTPLTSFLRVKDYNVQLLTSLASPILKS